jgi:hypothetical protein
VGGDVFGHGGEGEGGRVKDDLEFGNQEIRKIRNGTYGMDRTYEG